MTMTLLGLALVFVGYLLGFIAGVWSTRSWIEEIAPGTSRHLLELQARQRKNRK